MTRTFASTKVYFDDDKNSWVVKGSYFDLKEMWDWTVKVDSFDDGISHGMNSIHQLINQLRKMEKKYIEP